jgi:DNA-binding NarL/FixJ family response regulator
MTRSIENSSNHLKLVCIDSPYPVVRIGLTKILEEAQVHVGRRSPEGEAPSAVILCPCIEGALDDIERVRRSNPQAMLMVFGLSLDLALARAALTSGARGFIHVGMTPKQIIRALEVASEGEIVAPRQLLEYLIVTEEFANLDMLSARQREILEFVGEGLTNAQIARRLFLTESTVKQHLRSAYKVLGVSNRTEAVRLVRNGASEASATSLQ